MLAVLQQLGKKSFSCERGSGSYITVSTPSVLQGCWRFPNGLGDGLEFPGMRSCRAEWPGG